MKTTNECSPKDNSEKWKNWREYFHGTNSICIHQSYHGIVEDNSDTIIEQGLSKDKEVKPHVHVDLLKYGQNCHGVHSGYQTWEDQTFYWL